MPPTDYRRPVLVDSDSLRVRVVGEAGQDNCTYTFCGLDAPSLVVAELVASFSRRTGSGGSWRSRASAKNGAGALRRFAGHLGQFPRPPERIEEITAGMWNDDRFCLRASAAWPQQTYATRALLAGAEGLTDEARWALARPMTNRRRRKETAYSLAEFRRIRVGAWQTVNAATPRIRALFTALSTGSPGSSKSSRWRTRRSDRVLSGPRPLHFRASRSQGRTAANEPEPLVSPNERLVGMTSAVDDCAAVGQPLISRCVDYLSVRL